MKIEELHKDIKRYLLDDCYCSHEIYSFDGFCYQLFYEDQDCEKIGEINTAISDEWIIGCIAHPNNDTNMNPQVILFFINKNGHCFDSIRYDATENNIKISKDILTNGINGRKFKFDEYEPGRTTKSIKEIMSIADAIMIN